MDWNRLINMVTRMFLRKAVNKGIDFAARRGKSPATLTPEDRQRAQSAKEMADKAKKAARIGRRFMK
ncbi:hypothetical protein [Tabrizicola aquatica]|jgi:hypothetical protein|uniref:hypothetical protein n=1 Tax=Tabrizicola aquatica TaxID=909926 RepID=UPI000CD30EE9|nr:hypothetical protein [Tabrizicola aquatica]